MNIKTGQYGEHLSQQYLTAQGYRILTNNYRTKLGEIDIVVRKDNLIVFVEVKTRKSIAFGMPREAVTYKKQLVLHKLAQQYISYYHLENLNFRFDVMEVILKNNYYEIEHIENAF